jgi:hypothetical protein
VTLEDRLNFGGLAWDVTGIAPIVGAPEEIEFTCTASRG